MWKGLSVERIKQNRKGNTSFYEKGKKQFNETHNLNARSASNKYTSSYTKKVAYQLPPTQKKVH
jgi:hypothetical protein